MKKLSTILAALAMVILWAILLPTEAKAAEIIQSGTCGENLTWTLDAEGTLTISGYGKMEEFVYQEIYETGHISDVICTIPWYSYRTSITKVEIGDQVESIGRWAFRHCSNLTEITIPNNVQSVSSQAFSGCSSLKSMTLPYTGKGYTLFGQLFATKTYTGCTELRQSTGTSTVVYYIPSALSNIHVTVTGDAIAAGAFSSLGSRLKSVTIEDGVTRIGACAFYECGGLSEIKIPDSVTTIGQMTFSGLYQLTEIDLPDNLTEIGNYFLKGCSNLTAVTIPDGVTSIGSNAFVNCTSLKSITIPGSVTTIGQDAFYNCASLTDITFADNRQLTSVDLGAFNQCGKLSRVHISDVASWCAVKFSNQYSQPLYFAKNLYINGELVTNLVIPEGVRRISRYTFYGCTSITNVVLHSTMVDLDRYVFEECTKLKTITYCGTEEQWKAVYISTGNNVFKSAKVSYHDFDGGDCITASVCKYCGAEGEMVHMWLEATCTSKKFCFLCGVTEGDYAHEWVAATCTSKKYCRLCGKTEGEPLGHTWKDATCTKPKTCTRCGITEGTTAQHTWVGATCTTPETCASCGITSGSVGGHSYDNDRDYTCNVCGYVRLVQKGDLGFYGNIGLSFQDYIGMQVLVQNSALTSYDKFYVIAVQETPDGLVETVLNGKLYYGAYQMFEQKIVSWSMSEKVTLTLYGEKNGVIYEGQTVSASVEELALTKLATYKAQNNAKACAALVDMLNYGAAVQDFFGRNTDKLPNANLGEFAAFGSTGEPALAKTNAITGTGKIPVLTDNISMQEKVELQLLFAIDISAYTPKAVVNGQEATVEVDKTTYGKYGWTLLKVAVSAENMRDDFTMALYDGNGNAVTQIYTVSVEGYANGRKDTDKHAIDVALMRYGDSIAAL